VVEDTADAAPSGNHPQTWRPRHLRRIGLTQPDLSRRRSSAPSQPEKLGNTSQVHATLALAAVVVDGPAVMRPEDRDEWDRATGRLEVQP
jgi:hypothetical protein